MEKVKYSNIINGRFISRPNRFIANVDVSGCTQVCHVKNTGRCKELLVPGANVILTESRNPKRKTRYDLVSVYKGQRLINMDSQAPNILMGEFLRQGRLFDNVRLIRPESFFNSSRFDFYIETDKEKIFAEVKGVTLEKDGAVFFPDAPTLRGVKHLNELVAAKKSGYRAAVVFVIQMKNVEYFSPNYDTHPEFAAALSEAAEAGVEVYAFDCEVTQDSVRIMDPVEIRL